MPLGVYHARQMLRDSQQPAKCLQRADRRNKKDLKKKKKKKKIFFNGF